MRVIARSTLIEFVKNRVPRGQQAVVKSQLDAWYQTVRSACWKNSAELKAHLQSTSILSAERAVFNIKGNDYRLIASINYAHQILFVKWLGTHREYDEIDARKVEYDEDRYLG
ncbi:MAG TPA: type II toxin-antitoxin system HigB family toxin [Acidobacteriaceae bacterium]|jgi:mRNA interferase HigB|nr:type II toxin-antitoxin system HigB family toxin [Acidobacteriaceae bacterium]